MKKKWLSRKKKNESGQALVEFVLVLPLFMLILMGILDFGWLFFNYIGVENSARNAARIACVEYTKTNYNTENNANRPYAIARDYDPNFIDSYNTQEKNIIKAAKSSMPSAVTFSKMTIEYSYDVDNQSSVENFDVNGRANGSVKVRVETKLKVLTPVLGVFSENMKFPLNTASTYKVEKMPPENNNGSE